mgnify:FL=1
MTETFEKKGMTLITDSFVCRTLQFQERLEKLLYDIHTEFPEKVYSLELLFEKFSGFLKTDMDDGERFDALIKAAAELTSQEAPRWEMIAGWLLDVCFHARWWDYSDKPLNFHGYICLEFSLIWGLAIVMVVKVFQKYVENQVSHTPATWEWVVIAILYAVYLADFIVTVAVIRGLNKKLTRLDKVSSDLRIVSDKLSDTLATTTIDTAQKVGERKVQAALAKAELLETTAAQKEKTVEMLRMKKAELQAQFDELSSSITNHTVFGQGRLLKAFPEMKHRDYFELIQELKKKLK